MQISNQLRRVSLVQVLHGLSAYELTLLPIMPLTLFNEYILQLHICQIQVYVR